MILNVLGYFEKKKTQKTSKIYENLRNETKQVDGFINMRMLKGSDHELGAIKVQKVKSIGRNLFYCSRSIQNL